MNEAFGAFNNNLLRSLPADGLAALAHRLEESALGARSTLIEGDRAIDRIWFPASGLVTVIAKSRNGGRIEAGLVGAEGMVGIAVLLGDDRSPHDLVVQVAGEGHWIETPHLREVLAAHPEVTRVFLRYVHAFMIQTAHTALADGRGRLDQRLARWVLMAHDRVCRAEVPVTHEVLASMLGVRRAGVTVALNGLERVGAIGMNRGVVVVRDRAQLESLAGGWYGVPEREYRRLLGDPWAQAAKAAA